tara:strand:+ start:266 stop:472 length:207 start_codon:yes stop_codon:yes gene_type:complete
MINEQAEMTEVKTHSIVSTDCELRENHIGEPVSYNGVEGKLIRYIPGSGVLMELTLTEAIECLEQNRA